MLKWPSILGGSDNLTADELARLVEVAAELADDYDVPGLPGEVRKVATRRKRSRRGSAISRPIFRRT